MGTTRPQLGTAVAAAAIVAGMLATLVGAWSVAGGAANRQVDPDHGNHYHYADLDGHGRFTQPGHVWPPRPATAGAPSVLSGGRQIPADAAAIELESAVGGSTAEGPQARSAQLEPAAGAELIVVDAALAEALGDRWAMVERGPFVDGKGGATGETEEIYFSHSHNQSVVVRRAGTTIVSIARFDPLDFQPALGPSEAELAVLIARDHWSAAGDDRVPELEGYAIQAFAPGGGHYDVRMAYVSFHTDADALPERLTWVDLTNGVVTSSEVG